MEKDVMVEPFYLHRCRHSHNVSHIMIVETLVTMSLVHTYIAYEYTNILKLYSLIINTIES